MVMDKINNSLVIAILNAHACTVIEYANIHVFEVALSSTWPVLLASRLPLNDDAPRGKCSAGVRHQPSRWTRSLSPGST